MAEIEYPSDIDLIWLARDVEGHVGAFATGGTGPIPVSALVSPAIPLEDVEQELCELPIVSEAMILIRLKRPDDFVEFAKRGLFAYDWTDVHRTAQHYVQAYELVAAPTKPITVEHLPPSVAAAATSSTLGPTAFSAGAAVDVAKILVCRARD